MCLIACRATRLNKEFPLGSRQSRASYRPRANLWTTMYRSKGVCLHESSGLEDRRRKDRGCGPLRRLHFVSLPGVCGEESTALEFWCSVSTFLLRGTTWHRGVRDAD